MNNNALLAHLQQALGLDEARVAHLFALSGSPLDSAAVGDRLRATDPVPCSDREIGAFLDGLILDRRGPRPADAPAPKAGKARLKATNNVVLKKLRIALALKEEETAAVFAAGGLPMDHYALGALFRQEGQTHFRACTDVQLLAFVKGISAVAGASA